MSRSFPKRRTRPRLPWTAVALGFVAATACGGDGDPSGVDPVDPSVASVAVVPSQSTLTWLGETVEFSATPRDASGNALAGKSVSWTSLDESVALIDATGEATAVGNGQAAIRATVEGVSGEASLTVSQVATELSLSPGSLTFDAVGDTLRITAKGLDAGGSPVDPLEVGWGSADPQVAEIDEEGLVTALSEGSTVVTATVGEVQADAGVSVEQIVTSLVVLLDRDTLDFLGDSTQLEAEGRDRLDNPVPGIEVEWTTADPEIAVIDGDGWARAVANGVVEVTAVLDTLEVDTVLVVRQRATDLAIAVQPGEATAGETFGMAPEVEVRDAGGSAVVIDSETEVTVAVESGAAELQGAFTVVASEGSAVFADLSLEGTAGEHVLAFSAEGLGEVLSEPFELGPGAPAALASAGGDGQVAPADTELPDSLTVAVADAWDNGVPGIEVGWSVVSGEGETSSEVTETGATGTAGVVYTLGRFAAEDTIRAEAGELDGSPVEFVVTATPNATISGVVSLSGANLTAATVQDVALAEAEWSQGPEATLSTFQDAQEAPSGGPRPPAAVVGGSDLSLDGRAPSGPEARGSREPEAVPGELIVTLRPEAVDAPSARAMAHIGLSQARRLSDRIRSVLTPMSRMEEGPAREAEFRVAGVSPVTLGARIRLEDPTATDAVRNRLLSDPRVAQVEPNWIIHRDGGSGAGDPTGSRLGTAEGAPATSGFPVSDPDYPRQAWHYAMIDAPAAWEITTGSPSVIVAVVDDGIRFDHPDIAANLTSDGYDFVSNDWEYDFCGGGTIDRAGDGDGYDPDPTIPFAFEWDELNECISALKEFGGHGLHVAGTIGAVGDDGIGGTGLNWDVAIRPVRAFDIIGGATDFDVTQGTLYAAGLPADDGQGGTVQAPQLAHIVNMSFVRAVYSTQRRSAIEAIWEAGVLMVAAAGNDASSIANYPAAFPEVISVSALAPDGTLAPYSSFGSTIELAAPGGDRASGCDFAVWSTTWNFQTNEPNWNCQDGTSMAAPHVSGVAALILAQEPGLSASQLRSRLRDWAIDLGDANLYGYGLVDARSSLTQSFIPDGEVHAVLYDVMSGGEVERSATAPDGSFEFRELPDAAYFVFAGRDQDGDGILGIPRRWWGGFGGSTDPDAVIVDGAGEYPASFSIGFPLEAEPNDTFAEANHLPVGGYVQGIISDASDVDVFRVQIPEAGLYTFETAPLAGACGFALEVNTILQLYDGQGTLLREEHDIDADALNLCSRITESLEPGTHYIAVWGTGGIGRYGVQARTGG